MTVDAIHSRINELLTGRGWTLYKLAEQSGLPQSSLYTMMNRNTMPQFDTLQAICNALGITLSDFFAPFSKTTTSEYISQKDMLIIETVHSLPDSLQDLVLAYAKGLSDAYKLESNNKQINNGDIVKST